MNKLTPKPAIEHLSRADIETLTAEYLSGTKVSDLISRFNIKCPPSQLWKVLPPRALQQSCPACGSVMVQDVPSRSYATVPKIRCSSCSHEEGDRCCCKHCQELRDRLLAEEKAKGEIAILQALIADYDRCTNSSSSLNTLPLSLAVAFLAFTRCCPVNKNGLYGRLKDSPVPFAPKGVYGDSLLTSLREAGLIGISVESKADSISYRQSQLNFDLGGVCWIGDIDKNTQLAKDIASCGLTGNWPEHWYAEVEANWLQLALAECREFYDYCANERDLRGRGDKAVTEVLENILRDFSAGQCCRIISQGAKNAADYLARTKTSRVHAGNYMSGACQRWADTARARQYQVKAFTRNSKLPRSMISHVLFDVILKIGDRGFDEPIRLSALGGGSDNA
jgi:hypothetical protein